MTATLVLLAALATVPQGSPIVRADVDVIDRNTVLTDEGCVCFQQLICWVEPVNGIEIAAWRSWQPSFLPYRRGASWFLLFVDSDGTIRQIRATSYRESMYFGDSEVKLREFMPHEARRGLGKGNQ